MQLIRGSYGVLCVGLALVCAGCGHRFTVPSLVRTQAQCVQEKEGVQVLARALPRDECASLFQRPAVLFDDVKCVVLTVINQSETTVILDRAQIGAELLDATQVRRIFGVSEHARVAPAVGYYFLTPLVVGGVAGLVTLNPIAFSVCTLGTCVASIPLIIIDVAKSAARGSDVGGFIDESVLKKVRIASGNTCSTLLFMRKIPAALPLTVLTSGRVLAFMLRISNNR